MEILGTIIVIAGIILVIVVPAICGIFRLDYVMDYVVDHFLAIFFIIVFALILCFIIYMIVIIHKGSKVAKYDEKFEEWNNKLNSIIESIENKLYCPAPQNFQNEFQQFDDLCSEYDDQWGFNSETSADRICSILISNLREYIQCKNGINIAFNSLIALQACYQYYLDPQYKQEVKSAVEKMSDLVSEIDKILFFIEPITYGEYTLPFSDSLSNEDEFSRLLNELQNANNRIIKTLDSDNYLDIFKCISSIDAMFTYKACKTMWYYARKRPFDVAKFNDARQLFMVYTRFITKIANDSDGENIEFGPVESVLAAIFAQNQIGGEKAIDKKYLDKWVDWNVGIAYSASGAEGQRAIENCFLLCSGLAWMELYNLEKETLRKLFTQEIQLPNELQERLTFLESGGNSKIKIYKSTSGADFLYDSSSQNWNDKDLDMFFRQLSLKQDKLGYSLVIEDWKKTIPLVPGTQVSQERLSNELAKLVDDFDGEVTSKVVNAKAVNLLNEVYPNATVFTFTSERSRCVSILFSCEKFGRNLNITIMTLFTPDSSLTSDKLYPYAAAIKGNIYISSFKESILQVVDEVIHIKEKMYDDDSASTSQQRKVFDGE